MQRKHSPKYLYSQDDAQPWDSYVTDTIPTANDQENDTKDKSSKR
jgi:hypothetical protein